MVKKKLDYYYITLSGGISSLMVEGKIIPLIGLFIAKDDLREVISAKKVLPRINGELSDGLSYEEIIPVPEKEIDNVEKIILNMTIPEKEQCIQTLNLMEEKAKEKYFLKDAYGVGDVMMKKLMYKSLMSKDSK